jgi:energy-coupling factor transport system substrate-specific component
LDKKLTVRQIVLFGMLGALIFAAKYVMAFLPNIEPVSLMVMLCAVVFGRKAAYPIALYVVMEFLFYGLGLWNINYLYIWAILAIAAGQMRNVRGALPWAILSGTFGLLFGALCAPVDVVIGGFGYAAAKWVSGIPFDVAHCVGNFAIALVMFIPMRNLLEKLYAKLMR